MKSAPIKYRGFTATRNYLLDKIIPRVIESNATAGYILLKIERETTGFHRDEAEISNQDFCQYTGKSINTIRKSIEYLIESGYISRDKGGGMETSKYRLFLSPQQKPQSDSKTEAETSAVAESFNSSGDVTEAEAEKEIKIIDDDNLKVPNDRSWDTMTEDEKKIQEASKPVKSSGEKIDPVATNKDSLNIYNKHTLNEEEKQTNKTVCYNLKKMGFEVSPKNYKFIAWLVKKFGEKAVKAKFQIMQYQQQRGVKFKNPFGWLRSALEKDYSFAHVDREKIKAKKRAQLAIERQRREKIESEKKRREWEKSRQKNPNAAAEAYEKYLKLLQKAAV